jgi:hypothetical protein
MVARIRVTFSDPDATDSDDSGDESGHCPRRKAANKAEMIILVTACTPNRNPTTAHAAYTIIESASPPPPPPPLPKMRGAKKARSTPKRRFPGVYERKPGSGRWSADFRFWRPDGQKVRQWIGTFPSEEEAKAAYDAVAAEFSLDASVKPAKPTLSPTDRVPVATPTRSIVLDESDQSETGLMNHQSDAPSTVSSPPPPPAAVASHKPQPYADERQMEEPFLAEVLAHDDLIGLVDLADLPLPSLDDRLDFSSGEWSLLNGNVVGECNLGS